jgi:hypothetical protein
LAVQEGDVRDRLRSAYNHLRVLREDELPEEIRDEWKQILHELTRKDAWIHESGHVIKSSLDQTLDSIRNKTGRKIAERIYIIAIDL